MLHSVATIDREIYQCIVTEKMITDEVIITDERIEHIIKRRGQKFYDQFRHYFADIVMYPNYIFQAGKNTALVCKKMVRDEKYINIVLRLAVSTDNPKYKNSIITVVGENEKRFLQRLRNNNPLYKRE